MLSTFYLFSLYLLSNYCTLLFFNTSSSRNLLNFYSSDWYSDLSFNISCYLTWHFYLDWSYLCLIDIKSACKSLISFSLSLSWLSKMTLLTFSFSIFWYRSFRSSVCLIFSNLFYSSLRWHRFIYSFFYIICRYLSFISAFSPFTI